ncbi:MAG: PKD domain-containing protein, partial [Gammaproteobacteria bacterium]
MTIDSIGKLHRQLLSLAVVMLLVAGLAACTSDPEDPNMDPGPTSPQLPLINDLPDFQVNGPGWVTINAGGNIRATSFHWRQISAGTPYNLLNADTRRVEFLVPEFSATSPDGVRTVTLRLEVADDNGDTASDDVTVTIPPRLESPPGTGNNTPPVIEELSDVVVRPGQTVELAASATDAEDGVPAFHWYQITGPVLGLTNNDLTSATLSFQAPSQISGATMDIWFIVQVTDSAGDSAQIDVLIQVTNAPPVANARGDLTVKAGQLVTVQGSGSDSDGSIAQYQWRQLDGPTVLLQNADSETVSFVAPTLTTAADIVLEFTVTDNAGATATDLVLVTVRPTLDNIPPVANAGADQIVNPGDNVALLGSGSDDDGTIESYQWTQQGGPPVTINGANSAGASFSMPTDVQGQSSVTLRLTVTDDQGATGSDEVEVFANQLPVANAGADYSVRVGDTATLPGSASDPDPEDSVVGYQWEQIDGPAVDIINSSSANASFVPQTTGVITFRLTVMDNHDGVDTDDVVVTVNPANIAPTADAGNDLTVASGSLDPVVIDGVGRDTDGSVVAYQWTQVGGPGVQLIGRNAATVTFDVPTVNVTSIITLRLTVTDDAGDTGSDEVSITVTASVQNSPPIVQAGVDQTVNVGDSVTLSGTASDPDGDSLTYQWHQIDGPPITLNNADTLQASFVAPQVNTASTVTVQLDVTDSNGATASDRIAINILPSNNAPVANAGPDRTVVVGSLVVIEGSGTDSDGTVNGYQWSQLAGSSVNVTLNNANTAAVSFNAPTVTANTTITLRLTVTDNDGATDFDDVNVTITPDSNANLPPVVSAGPDISAVSGETVSITGTA